MSDYTPERRQYSRVAINLPVEVQQGGSVWHQRLIDLSLGGAATDQPALWDAQYNEPFTLVIHISDSSQLELHAYHQHVEAGRLGFSVEHVDRRNIAPLRALLEQHINDITVLEQELQTLHGEAD